MPKEEIVLSPKRLIDSFPSREEDYLLTMMDISEIQLPGIGWEAGFDEISQWAPSKLIGDNAKFDFGNWPGSTTPEEQWVK